MQETATRYSYRPSLRGGAWSFELTEAGLSWNAGRRAGVIAYSDIVQIGLSYRPVSMQRRRFRMDIRTRDGRTLPVASATWLSVISVEPQDEAYRAFVRELHKRVGAGTSFRGGLRGPLYWLGIAMLALVGAALASLFVRALVDGVWQGAAFMAAFAALFGWQIGGFVWRNRPIGYSPQSLPPRLLP